jgi:hypothetical protein
MKIRVTRVKKSSQTTQSWSPGGNAPPEVVEGTLVLYRAPSLDGRPRWIQTDLGVEDAVERGGGRLALTYCDAAGQLRLWASGAARVPPSPTRGGLQLVTERSTYLVEVLAEGHAVRRSRRDTGSFPIYDLTPLPEAK